MSDTDTVPPRRSKRSSAAISPIKPTSTSTPSQRPKKKARFSEPILPYDTTGLTPAITKASLNTPRRRVSTPAITRYRDHDEIQFTPMRQQLTARTQRQIRRLGLSDEQNQFYAEKKSKAELLRQLEQKNKELHVLKDELEASKLRETSLVQSKLASSQERISRLEDEVADLTQQSFHEPLDFRSNSPAFGDDGGFDIYEDTSVSDENQPADADDDATVDLELESARQAKEAMFRSSQSFSNSFVHFEDSPARSSTSRSIPSAPETSASDLSKELNEAINRAEEAEVALQAMTSEIKSLGFPSVNTSDAAECISSIKSHFRDMRLELERTYPGELSISFTPTLLMPEMLHKLKLVSATIRDREAELRSMHEQQRSLKGNFDHALIAAGKANARFKELEDAMDKNAEEMLDQRMRAQALERESQEHQKNNQSLIVAIEKYRQEVKRLEDLVELIEAEQASRLQDVRTATTAEFTQQISDMDANVAAETRGRRAAEDSAVERLRKINELESALSTARQQSETVEEQLQSLQDNLNKSETNHLVEKAGLNSRISGLSTALTNTNAQVEKLSGEVRRLETLYRDEVARGEEFAQHQTKNILRLAAQSAEDKKAFIRGSKVRLANWELESERDDLPSDPVTGPMTPSSMVRFSEFSEVEDNDTSSTRDGFSNDDYENDEMQDDYVEGRVELSRGRNGRRRSHSSVSLPASSPFLGRSILKKKPRRRYDSGIGMDSSGLSEAEDEGGVMTPELSSEADFDGRFEVDNDVMV